MFCQIGFGPCIGPDGHYRPNGYWTKWALDEMGIGQDGNWAKWALDQMGIGPNEYWTK